MSLTSHIALLLAAAAGVAHGMNVAVDRAGRLMLVSESLGYFDRLINNC